MSFLSSIRWQTKWNEKNYENYTRAHKDRHVKIQKSIYMRLIGTNEKKITIKTYHAKGVNIFYTGQACSILVMLSIGLSIMKFFQPFVRFRLIFINIFLYGFLCSKLCIWGISDSQALGRNKWTKICLGQGIFIICFTFIERCNTVFVFCLGV